MMTRIRRWFARRRAGHEPDSYYVRLHEASINAVTQTREAKRSTRQLKRDVSDTLAVPPLWARTGGRHDR